MQNARIIGTGSYVPDRVLNNFDLEKMVDTSDEWIQQRTGIRERRICRDDETNVTMGCIALQRAIENAQICRKEIDLLVVGTNTSKQMWPSAAGAIAKELRLREGIGIFDVQAGCAGFTYAFGIAGKFVQTEDYKTVAVIGTDELSAVTDYSDKKTCVLFGDGAGAVVIQHSEEQGLIRSHLGSDAANRHLLYLDKREITRLDGKREMGECIWMDGKRVYIFAQNAIVKGCLAVMGKEYSIDDINWIVPHQANGRIIEAAAGKLAEQTGRSYEQALAKMIVTLHKYGNNSAASVALALDESLRNGTIKKGDLIILTAFGAGLTEAAALVRV